MNTYSLLACSINHQLGKKFSADELTQIQAQLLDANNLIQTAETHGVAPIFYQFVKDLDLSMAVQSLRQLKALTIRHRRAASAREIALKEIIPCLKSENIDLILLKGAALAHSIYAKPYYRPMRDIDILIRKSDIAKTKALLEQLGFEFDREYPSIYMKDIHHLPNSTKTISGMTISLEVHHQIFSRDIEGDQTINDVFEQAQTINIDDEINALTLDHAYMLNHLCRHSFSFATEVRLIHQYDIVRYIEKHYPQINWQQLKEDHPFILNTLACLTYSIELPQRIKEQLQIPKSSAIKGVGESMLPYSYILADRSSFTSKLKKLFSPSPWWMHVTYNTSPDKSLVWCYLYHHPKRVIKDVLHRLSAAITNTI